MTDVEVPPTDRPHRRKDMSGRFADVIDQRVAEVVERFSGAARGLALRDCPLCQYYGRFTPFGSPPRLDARCPKCNSLERHRLYAILVAQRPELFDASHKVLHFAAEGVLRRLISPRVGSYETADLSPRTTPNHQINIEATGLPDASYDRIVCNHVLEHVDDRAALAEMFRILKPGGVALLSTPIIEGWSETYENPAVDGRAMRVLHFGQEDHVRYFGRDIRDRIRAAGFELEDFVATEPEVHLHGLQRGECLFIATRPLSDGPRRLA